VGRLNQDLLIGPERERAADLHPSPFCIFNAQSSLSYPRQGRTSRSTVTLSICP
jgi:hypothetical protein